MRKTKKIMAALLTAAMVIGSLTGCGGGNSATSTNDKGEIAELINAVQPESGEYDPAGAAAYEYFSVQTSCYEGFVSYDKELLELTTLAIRIYSVAYLFNGLNIFTSSFFTALNNGAVSAAVSFLRMFVFQIAMIMILPLILGINGIWMAVIAAELLVLFVSLIFIIINRKKYGYV